MSQERKQHVLREGLREFQRVRQALKKVRSDAVEPLAVIGMACRTPGGAWNPQQYWELLREGKDAIGPFPRRWSSEHPYGPDPEARGNSYAREGGFLEQVDEFDAEFFGISPREALAMAPQQRLLLETAWESLERAGLTTDSLAGSQTGVYLGAQSSDYGLGIASQDSEGYRATGQAISVLAGRVAYTLDWKGPALTVDTACSSSLVAIHLACNDLRNTHCDLALAGGVQVMSSPAAFVEFSRLRGLAADGRCKAFSAQADGSGWSEGVGVLLLKRLSDAQRDGDPVLALVRGTAINQDGRTSGLTAPSGPSQQEVVRACLERHHLRPEDIDAVEAHGTGTSLGDPIEAIALTQVFTAGRDRPLWIGSSKSNLGHTQAAAGVLGVIKMILALQHELLPRTLHVAELTSHVPWQESCLSVLQKEQSWPRTPARIRRAGVSSFGVSGTNAHLVLEEAPKVVAGAPTSSLFPLLLSAQSPSALRTQAARWADWLLEHPELPMEEVALSSAVTRTHLRYRASLHSKVRQETIAGLRALAIGEPHPALQMGEAKQRGKLVFVLPGQGSQWSLMGRSLLQESEVFRETVRACEEAFAPYLDWSVDALLRETQELDGVDLVQPALFTVGVSLAAVWSSLGMEPQAVVGHSQGEMAAAVISGALSLDQGARIVALRSQLLREQSGQGGMLAVELPVTEVQRLLRGNAELSIAVVNTESSVVLSGPLEPLRKLEERLKSQEIYCKRVEVDYASHNLMMDPVVEELVGCLGELQPAPCRVPMVSTLDGEFLTGAELDGQYWARNLRQPVRFDKAMKSLLASGHEVFLELSPHPVLALALSDWGGVVSGSLQRQEGELGRLYARMGELHVQGVKVDWKGLVGPGQGRALDLPTYPFERRSYWLGKAPAALGFYRLKTVEASMPSSPEESLPLRSLQEPLPDGSLCLDLRGHGLGARQLCGELLSRLKEWLHQEGPRTLTALTEAAVAWRLGKLSVDVAGAAGWGLLRSLRCERPDLQVRLIDSDGLDASETVLEAALGAEGVREGVLRRGRLFGLELDPLELNQSAAVSSPLGAEGTVLITGATGELGQLLAQHLVARHGVQHLLLLSRSGEASGLTQRLTALGAKNVRLKTCDVSDREALASVLDSIDSEQPLSAVFHLAAVLRDATFANQSPSSSGEVLSAKLESALLLDELTRGFASLSHFVLFSSVTGALGGPGASSYAAANAGLDALAAKRRAEGLPALSLAWSAWQGVGMAGALSRVHRARGSRSGLVPGSVEQSLGMFDRALHRPGPWLAIMGADAAARAQSPLLGKSEPQRPKASLDQELSVLEPAQRLDWLVELVRSEAAAVLGASGSSSIAAGRPLQELGLDSLMALELRNRLAARSGQSLRSTLAFDYPTPQAIASFLLALCNKESGSGVMAPEPKAEGGPIALLGMACRGPGGIESPEDYWRLLSAGHDATEPLPENWARQVGSIPGYQSVRGGFLRSSERFDARFFAVSDPEAKAMTPNQRLVLEVAWEALERARVVPLGLEGSRTGVYFGAETSDYPASQSSSIYSATGRAASVLSGRLAYLLDLQGPAITLDTSCSSSLVAIHLACAALRAGECEVALAGGVQVKSTPGIFLEFAAMGGLAKDGRCKAFSEGADGTGFADGVGVLVLKRLSDCQRDRDPVLAVIPGSAVNQDGRSQGLTAPNGPSQQRVIREALGVSGLRPDQIDTVEAHGTGTALGDPIEAGALSEVFAQGRITPLWIGSSKSNLGHAQAAAGVLGVIKMVLALQHELLPRTLHAESASSALDQDSGLTLLQESQPWPRRGDRLRRAGVSSFGISGTNAHLVLEEAPAATESESGPAANWQLLVLSGQGRDALVANAHRLGEHLAQHRSVPIADLSYSLSTTRTHFTNRLALPVSEQDKQRGYPALLETLRTFPESLPGHAHTTFYEEPTAGLVMLFSGQGSQRPGMGRGLYSEPTFAVFRTAFGEALEACQVHLDHDLREVMWSQEQAERLASTEFAQPALFVLETALFRQWEAWGLSPDLLLGHSVGEIAVAHLGGVFSLTDAARLVCERGRLMQALGTPGGAMASLEASFEEVASYLTSGVEIAALNGPGQVVVSGDAESVEALCQTISALGRRVKKLEVSRAFHSAHMEAVLEPLRAVAAELTYQRPKRRLVSSVTGELVDHHQGDFVTPDYWVRQAREVVRFRRALECCQEHGGETFLECGPALTFGTAVPTLRADREEPLAMFSALGALFVEQRRIDWEAVHQGLSANRIDLPTYAFQGRPYGLGDSGGERLQPHLYSLTGMPATAVTQHEWKAPCERRVLLDLRGHGLTPEDLCCSLLDKLQGALGSDELETITVVTESAMMVGPGSGDVAAAAAWGLVRSLRSERPELVIHLLDCDTDERTRRLLAEGLPIASEESVVRQGELFDLKLRRVLPRETPDRMELGEGTVLITGGTGDLGGLLVDHLLSRYGVKRIILLSRSGGGEVTNERVRTLACDILDRTALSKVLTEIPPEAPLCAVFHLAAVTRDSTFQNLDGQSLREVLAPKLRGAALLDELTRGIPTVAHFVVFSSAAALFGSAGQANYAAANAGLSALVGNRVALHLPAQEIVWGPWAELGMTASLGQVDRARMERVGFAPLSREEALELLDQALVGSEPTVAALKLDSDLMRSPLLQGGASPQKSHLMLAATEDRAAWLLEQVKREVALVAGLQGAAQVPADRPVHDLGFDSLMAVELRNRLMVLVGAKLPTAFVFDFPDPNAMVSFLLGDRSPEPRPAMPTQGPVAIVGMSCRTPGGAHDAEQYWGLLSRGEDAISEGGPARWNGVSGGYLSEAELFDPAFFAISPREALAMEPQQRLVLEVAWHALESAGISAHSLRGSETGVYLGAEASDYSWLAGSEESAGLRMTGLSASVVSGRVSYVLDLKGPALTLDTACSSSLVALHYACRGLAQGECDLALAGGVRVMCTPLSFGESDRTGMMAEDGRCRAFSAEAGGAGWSEGVGVLVLKRVDDARRDGDRILALVPGSAVNQDGRSQGLTAPNGPSQQRVIRRALQASGLKPGDLDAVEAHGTGTSLGDPIEAGALEAVFGPDRKRPLWLGSSKSNIGHASAAAGVLGVIKMVLALQHQILPRTLHCQRPTPHFGWGESALSLLQEEQPWVRGGGVRRAGVSSFGMSGTNAHIVLQEAPEWERRERREPSTWLPLILSAHTPTALFAKAQKLAKELEEEPPELADLSFSAATSRSALAIRLALPVSFQDAQLGYSQLRESLQNYRQSLPQGGALTEGSPSMASLGDHRGKLAVMFSGQGSQRPSMGRELYGQPGLEVFSEAFDEALTLCEAELGEPLRETVWNSSEIHRTQFAQPLLFALERALFQQWLFWGVKPDLLLGHSLGELTAAHVSGILSLPDAVKLICARGRLMNEAAVAGGGMVAVQACEEEVEEALLDLELPLEVAAVNAVDSVVVTGAPAGLETFLNHFRRAGRRTKRLEVSHAFHSADLDGMLEAFTEVAASLTYGAPKIPVVSSLTGEVEEVLGTEYWVRQVRETVRFADAMECAKGLGVGSFLELGPGGGLSGLVGGTPTLRKNDETRALMSAVGALQVAGQSLDWEAFFRALSPRRVRLPLYPFQHRRFWPQSAVADAERVLSEWGYGERWCLADLAPPGETLQACWILSEPDSEYSWPDALAEAISKRGVATERMSLWTAIERFEEGELPAGLCVLFLPLPSVPPLPGEGLELEPEGLDGFDLAEFLCTKPSFDGRFWFLTPHALSVNEGDRPVSPMLQVLWGLGRTLSLEKPHQFGGLVDLCQTPESELDDLLDLLLERLPRGDEFALRDGRLWTRRLRRLSLPAGQQAWRPEGDVMITGGTGYLGAHLARWVASRGAQRLLLVSRSGAQAEGTESLRKSLQDSGCEVEFVSCNLADDEQVEALVGACGEVRHLFHLAGVSSQQALEEVGIEELNRVMDCKVLGALALDLAFELHQVPLKTFMVYGSIGGFWGSGFQASYCAANAALNGLVQSRRSQGLPASIVHWGSWQVGGVNTTESAAYLERRGVLSMPSELALHALERVLTGESQELVVANIDWSRFAPALCSARERPLLSELPEAVTALQVTTEYEQSPVLGELLALDEGQRRVRVLEILRSEMSQVLGLTNPQELSVDGVMQELGMDSLMASELRVRLMRRLGLSLPKGLLFDYPVPKDLAEFLSFQVSRGRGSWNESELRTRLNELPLSVLRECGLDLEKVMGRDEGSKQRSEPSREELGEASREELLDLMEGLLESRSGQS